MDRLYPGLVGFMANTVFGVVNPTADAYLPCVSEDPGRVAFKDGELCIMFVGR